MGLAGSSVLAQTTGTATLRGTVKDPAGLVVPGADVALTSEATGDTRSTISNDQGAFLFASLRPGGYVLNVAMPGFKTHEQSGILVRPAESRGIEVVLQIGEATEMVTVTAGAELIKTESGAKEDTITAAQIENLSIISRSSLELLRVLPGVVAPAPDQLESTGFGAGANCNACYNVNGLRGEMNNVSIDGSRVIDIGSNNGTILTANPDLVQEVTVQTSNYSAEYGTSGIQISAVTKGGTREFHGTIYNYVRNWRFAANDRSNNFAGVDRPFSKYQYPGGNVGGPVLIPGTNFNRNRDKLFFFVGFEVQRQEVDPGTVLATVPTLAQRQGDFSELLAGAGQNLRQPTQVFIPGDPGCVGDGGGSCVQPPNNNLAPFIDPIGQAFINLYPAPNFSHAENRFNYAFSQLQPLNRTQFISRFDYNFSDNTRLFVRLGRETEEQEFQRGLWWASSNFELPTPVLGENIGRSVSTSLVNVFSPTMTNELLVSLSRLKLDNDYSDPSRVDLDSLGLSDYEGMFGRDRIRNNYAPVNFHAWGNVSTGESLWEAGGLPLFAHNDSISVNDNVTKVWNAHAVKFGVFLEQANKKQNFDGNDEGLIALGSGWIPGSTGNDFGDLLVGRPAQFSQSTSTPVGHFRFYNYEAYVQDNWKVRPGFTLELGLRFGYLPNNFERDGLSTLFSPAAYDPTQGPFIDGDVTRPNGQLLASRGEIPDGIVDNPNAKFMPRIGFAWDVSGTGDTVIRGGAGIFYNRPQGNAQYYVLRQPPNVFNSSIDAWSGAGLGGGQGLVYSTLREVDPFTRLGAISLTSQNPDSNDVPQVTNMSLSVAKRMPWDNVLEVAYVGTQGRHLQTRRPINFIPLGALLSGTVGNADLSNPIHRIALNDQVLASFRPFPAYSGVQHIEYTATSNYHSLQATLKRQAGDKLQYFATYTFSKALGTVAINENGDVIDPIDARGRSYGILPYDRTHIFNISYNYHLPSLARGDFSNGFTRAVFDGWQMSGISTYQSGNPMRLRFSGDINSGGMARAWFGTDAFNLASGNSSGAISPVYLGNPQIANTGDPGDRLIDLSKLGIPGFGESGPNIEPFYMRTPNRWNFDVSFFKNFFFDDTKKLQFRAGFFNLFNQAFPLLDRGDMDLTLQANCNVRVGGVPDGAGGTVDGVCDPFGGFSFSDQTQQNFGRIVSKHGKRIVEFALKFYF